MEPDAATGAASAAEAAQREAARDLSRTFGRTAEVLERSAELAEEHARRNERAGGKGEHERLAAARSHQGALRAQKLAERFLKRATKAP